MAALSQLLQFAANGLVLGSILTLTAVGLTLVYGILHLANFAHGDLITLGAFLGLFFTAMIPRSTAMAWSLAVAGIIVAVLVADRLLDRFLDHDIGLKRVEAGWGAYTVLVLLAIVAGMTWKLEFPGGWGFAAPALVAASAALWSGRRRLVDLDEPMAVAAALVGVASIPLLFGLVGPALTDLRPMDPGWMVTFASLVVTGLGAVLSPPRSRGMQAGLAGALLVAVLVFASIFLLGTVLAVAVVVAATMGLDLVLWRPLRDQDAGLLTLIIASIGLALAIRHAVLFQWGGDLKSFPGAPQRALPILGSQVQLTQTQMIVIGISAAAIGLVHVLLRRTRTGKAMRALSDNVELARVTGIDVDRVILYVWAVAGGLAALSGILLGQIRPIHPELGWFLLLPIFAAVILGGIGSPYGAMAGGFGIGLAMETSPWFGVPSAYKPAVGFAILIAVLLVRPGGIFGGAATR